jgi:hypothetical protein
MGDVFKVVSKHCVRSLRPRDIDSYANLAGRGPKMDNLLPDHLLHTFALDQVNDVHT